jgi:hypothetical protein
MMMRITCGWLRPVVVVLIAWPVNAQETSRTQQRTSRSAVKVSPPPGRAVRQGHLCARESRRKNPGFRGVNSSLGRESPYRRKAAFLYVVRTGACRRDYRWEIIERDMDVWAQHGKKCWLEVSTAFRWDVSGRLGVPEWVYQKGVPKIQAQGSAPYPVYWNPLYLELWGRFVREMASKFDGDPRAEWVAVGGHTTGTEPRLSSKENDLVMDQWVQAGFDGFKPDGIYLQKAVLPIYRMFHDAFHHTQVSATFISTGEFSDVMNRDAAKMGFLLTNNGFGAKSATKTARETMRNRREHWNAKIGYAEFGPSGRDSRFMDENFKKPAGVSVKQLRDEAHTAKLLDIYQRALGDDNDPALKPSSRLSYLPLFERAPRGETEDEWNAALKWAWEHLEK